MSFTECARLAEKHPDLAGAVQKITAQLQELGTAGTIRPDDLASFLELDRNQVSAVMSKLAESGLLRAEVMLECVHCDMAVLRSDYNAVIADDGEYSCTDCDQPLQERDLRPITTYRRGQKWPDNSARPKTSMVAIAASPSGPAIATLDDETYYAPDRLAEFFTVNQEALRKRLERFRSNNLDGWRENEGRKPREAKYSYRLKDVRDILTELQASSQRPAK